MLIDSHCHLDFPDFGPEVEEVVTRAHAAGVGLMVTISTKVSEFDRVRAVAERFPHVFCTVGIHPHEAANEPVTDTATLVEMAKHPKVVGIGETGLDYYYEHSPREAQQRNFRAHIAAARETGLPLVVHTRDADDDTGRILDEETGKGAFPGLLHCFSSGPQLAEKALELGLYISLSGILTFKTADELRATAAKVPLDRLLVETDAPYLAPVPKRGKRNEPAFVVHTAAKLAEVKGVSAAQLAEATTGNFLRLFSRVPPDAVLRG
ncbi:TatD family hydrolase [Parvibaculum sp.]|uniref:TatD family hydrolase n=1 Tax=Parvibaculum sp. TaxID=2024848 RepID=UPI001DD08E4D|nr:TatD family hydrolase [Parvibaculum sp.]MBX3487871.1 TatD family hydrolase [Parvibaculum sp.]MCW5728135.1 TatD family hydrolase [Parvibaculum sp.]